MCFVMELLALNKLSYCKTTDVLPSQAFSAPLRSDVSRLLKPPVISHSTPSQLGPSSILMTKPITQVRTASVCTSHPICCFRNLESKALVLPFREILLSCRFTVPPRVVLIWQPSFGFEEKCTSTESLWTWNQTEPRGDPQTHMSGTRQ